MSEKTIIFSHESDIDGLGCIVLGNLSFKEMKSILVPNIEQLELSFRDYIESGNFDQYSNIFVTDHYMTHL